MQIPNEKVSVIRRQAHKCSTHNNEFDFVYRVTQLLQLQLIG